MGQADQLVREEEHLIFSLLLLISLVLEGIQGSRSNADGEELTE